MRNTEKKVILVDDDELVRRGIGDWLASLQGVVVVGEAGNAIECKELIAKGRPHVALVDVILPGVSGIELTREIKAEFPEVKTLILSGSSDPELVLDGFQNGAVGFLPKTASAQELQWALTQVCEQGNSYLSPSVTVAVMSRMLSMRQSPELGNLGKIESSVSLNDRERELLKLISEGYTFVQIAEQLDINPRSVERLKVKLEEKTGATSLVDLIRRAIKMGLIKA